MRILLIGAAGLIGAAVAARLKREGHEIIGLRRGASGAAQGAVDHWVQLDLRQATTPESWRPHLAGVDAVVNCAGVLQDNVRDSTARVHHDAPAALWRACEEAGIRRVIHLSALGVDRGGLTDFSRTKLEGDKALESSGLDWVILRPSVVVGPAAYGGSALFRGLAALPIVPRTPDSGPLDIVQLGDVTETVARLLQPGAPSRIALELAGPERLGFDEVVAAYRRWLGWKPARLISVPWWLMGLAYRAGDAIAWLGWRPAVRSTGRREIVRGAVGDGSAWRQATGIEPQGLTEALAEHPAPVQERWFAKLYFLKALAITTFALFWLLTGVISLTAGYDLARDYMLRAGAGPLAVPSVIAGGLADISVFCLMIYRPTTRQALWAAVALSVFYIVAGTILLPGLWRDPLGPMMKIWPILAFNFLCLAILEER
ncbi:SDR family oxidoreductase [Allosphingosinicella deserti]|uniref:Nucleoside-diphosphate sugar epimerase n=1 Tax=Allosphingosinicella deserti TaxID=2116704 RepID=A0A2P7QFK7_9SPHN|nr:SDR family oxidoreductase [Sphingomonas deserti]PSJ36716.1 nucleoside-diphosphate sugar epimerase [Sphingomonas deserti]